MAIEIIVVKWDMIHNEQFLLLQQWFQKLSSFALRVAGLHNDWLAGVRINEPEVQVIDPENILKTVILIIVAMPQWFYNIQSLYFNLERIYNLKSSAQDLLYKAKV